MKNNMYGRNADFDCSKIYYLSGPMSGYPEYNYPVFQATVDLLRAEGIKLLSPHENVWPEGHETMTPEQLRTQMMVLCMEQMKVAEGIIMMPGWPQSKGTVTELKLALKKELPVYFFDGYNIIDMNKRIA